MSLLDNLQLPSSRVLTEEYYVMLETHLKYLREHPLMRTMTVTGQQAEKYIGDLAGLLDTLGLDKKFHYLTIRLNGLVSSADYDGSFSTFFVPDSSVVTQFLATFDSVEH